ncbi:MAG TPA: tetratricopeptide repeat protein [Rhodocyclaceae bacterium]|nr:tetratricopeptide repeat protein [Rhodocyclaceae bacterium]
MSDSSSNAALIQEAFSNAVAHHQAGRLQEAEELYRAILQLAPQNADANHNLGVIAVQLQQPAASLPFFQAAVAANPGKAQFWQSYVEALNAAGETAAAQEVSQLSRRHGVTLPTVTSQEKNHAAATAAPPAGPPPTPAELQALAAAFGKHDYVRMERLAVALTQKYPQAMDGWKALSLARYHTQRFEDALPANLKMVELRPREAQPYADLGLILWRLRRLQEAEAAFLQAIALEPNVSDTHTNLGNVYKDQERLDEAAACYRRAIELDPKQAVPYSNLGVLLTTAQAFREAEACFRTALQLEPRNAFALRNLSTALVKLGHLGEAESVIRQAIAIDPNSPLAYDLLLFVLNYTHIDKAREARELAEQYGRLVAGRRSLLYREWRCEKNPVRLKVGLVSADLHSHPVGYFVESLVSNLSADRIELVAYVNMPEQKCDALTARIRPHFSDWKSIYRLSDQDAAALIHADGIHVLLDLSGHTTDNRLPLFAFKPAPVQASWLGYFATTGVAEMDYLIGDPWLCPAGEESHFTEAVWRLPQTWLSFTPPDTDIPVAPLPALQNGSVTFGCFNNLNKMNDAVVRLWADVLQHVPGSRLLLKAPQLNDPEVQRQTTARFAAHGIGAERLLLEGPSPRQEYLQAYARVDIALDPFPYPGGATSVDTLWMGVPVLTLRGNRFLAHLGESVAQNAGMPEWIATDHADLIRKAIAFAADLPALSALRSGLRERLRGSPLLDTKAFAHGFEVSLHDMWQRHAQKSPAPASLPVRREPPAAEIAQLQRLLQQGKLPALEKQALAITRKYPESVAGWRALAHAQQHSGRIDNALHSLQQLLAIHADDAAAHANLGYLLIRSGRQAEAEKHLQQALELDPQQTDASINLGFICRSRGNLDGAVAAYRQAIDVNPALASAHANLGIVLLEQHRLRAAEASLRQALKLAPADTGAMLALSSTLVKLGLLDEAESLARRLIQRDPDNAKAYDILLFVLNYGNTIHTPEALTLAQRFGAMLSRKFARQRYNQWLCDPQPTRLRIGLVSGDLYNHPVGYFLAGLLEALDTSRFEVFAYSNRPEHKHDAMSQRLRAHCAAWNNISLLDDTAAAALIHADGIHILLDLAGHTGENRLPVFACKPAPVQAAWLGYFATTGVEQMDYLIGDPNVCPAGEENHFTETVWRLPETYLCFTPPDADIAINDLPARENGFVTFGCFNNIGKLTDSVLATWSRILQQVPNARLLLKARQLADAAVCAWLRERFAAHGVMDQQLLLEGPTPREDYLRAYQRLDIVLDPFPYPGGTTTVEALWMSVPVLTLRGNRMLSHAGENIMRNIGLPEWIAQDEADYVAKAVGFAADPDLLATLRKQLRQQALASPMFDAPRFARHFENALTGMWAEKR